jgi:hypothetical protein
MDRIALGAEAEKQATALVAAKADPPQTPQLPADLEKCLKASLRAKRTAAQKPKAASDEAAKESADKLVLAKLEAEKRRQTCAYQLLQWHEKQKTAAVKK